jgi:hypothetical protein
VGSVPVAVHGVVVAVLVGVVAGGRVGRVLPPAAAQVDDGEPERGGDPGEGDGQARG